MAVSTKSFDRDTLYGFQLKDIIDFKLEYKTYINGNGFYAKITPISNIDGFIPLESPQNQNNQKEYILWIVLFSLEVTKANKTDTHQLTFHNVTSINYEKYNGEQPPFKSSNLGTNGITNETILKNKLSTEITKLIDNQSKAKPPRRLQPITSDSENNLLNSIFQDFDINNKKTINQSIKKIDNMNEIKYTPEFNTMIKAIGTNMQAILDNATKPTIQNGHLTKIIELFKEYYNKKQHQTIATKLVGIHNKLDSEIKSTNNILTENKNRITQFINPHYASQNNAVVELNNYIEKYKHDSSISNTFLKKQLENDLNALKNIGIVLKLYEKNETSENRNLYFKAASGMAHTFIEDRNYSWKYPNNEEMNNIVNFFSEKENARLKENNVISKTTHLQNTPTPYINSSTKQVLVQSKSESEPESTLESESESESKFQPYLKSEFQQYPPEWDIAKRKPNKGGRNTNNKTAKTYKPRPS